MSILTTLSVYLEIVLIPLVFILLLYTSFHIIRRNPFSSVNRFVGFAGISAAVAIPGTLVRSIFSIYNIYSLLGNFERVWRHIDMYFAFYFYFFLLCGFWLLLQEPETPLHKSFFIGASIITLWAIIDIFYVSAISAIFDYLMILAILLVIAIEFVLINIIIRKIYVKSTPTKKSRIRTLARGTTYSMVGFVFLSISGILRLCNKYITAAIFFESICTWLLWGIAGLLFYKGMPTKEAYFFDELNQSIVYNLQLPLSTTLDDIFRLIEKQLSITKHEIECKLKMERSIAEYINELSNTLKKKQQEENR